MCRSDGRQCGIVVVYWIARRIDFLLGAGVCGTSINDYLLCGEVFGKDSYIRIKKLSDHIFTKRSRHSYGIFFDYLD